MRNPCNQRFVITNQVRCNFCFNWVTGSHFHRQGLNICQNCIDAYVNKQQAIYGKNEGEIFKMLLFKQQEDHVKPFQIVVGQEEQQDTLQINQNSSHFYSKTDKKFDNNQARQEQSSFKFSEGQQQSYIQSFEQDSHLNQISQICTPKILKIQSKIHQSCIIKGVSRFEPVDTFQSMKKPETFNSTAKSARQLKVLPKYQFYFDHEILEQYNKSHPKTSRQYSNHQQNSEFNIQGILEPIYQKNRFKRSVISNEGSQVSGKLAKQELKDKIDTYLEGKSNSASLNRITISDIGELYQHTNVTNDSLQLFSYKLGTIDFQCYLNLFEQESFHTIKLVNVGLTDVHMQQLIKFIKDKKVQTLVLTGNRLSEASIQYFNKGTFPHLKELYLSRNSFCKTRIKQNIAQLHRKFTLYI